jgi:ankyrin repeat protein
MHPREETVDPSFHSLTPTALNSSSDAHTIPDMLSTASQPHGGTRSNHKSAAHGDTNIHWASPNHERAVNKPTFSGRTALHIAAEQGRTDIVSMLLGNGASPDVQDQDGATALYLAAGEGHDQIVQLLLDAGANATI